MSAKSSSGHPQPSYFVRDALLRLRRPLVPTIVSIFIVFAATLAIFATTGLAMASQQRALDNINSPEGRLITITDSQGSAGISTESLRLISSLEDVEWVFGMGPATDVHNLNVSDGEIVQARRVFGDFPPVIDSPVAMNLKDGQAVAPVEVLRKLGMADDVGTVSSRTLTGDIAGQFHAESPLTALNKNVLVVSDGKSSGSNIMTLWVSVKDVRSLEMTSKAVMETLVSTQPEKLRVTMTSELARLSQDVQNEMASTARQTVTGLLLASALLLSAVQFGRVSGLAKDIGRTRALGGSRSAVVAQILINAGLSGVLGAFLGIVAGSILTLMLAGGIPSFGFSVGVGILMVLAAIFGSIPPAVRAAYMDPVKILRVP
ncbi:ABC transporter permease family protein [Neomicrococcus lactis]|uniref:Putative ABC transport system permease protein n=1 Tax=Neomicrococcus lactis TaxID=732241 RepID=A0A7W9DAW2_9MICC|nr:ABC transporter permease [Neomicrococcus lactis]MBB5598070.1 putative ABC transport system permease protein [Neomicrococcus lactis]